MVHSTAVNIVDEFALFRGNGAGIESWISASTPAQVIQRLNEIDNEPISHAQLNQLLILSHEAGVSDGFFRYYWLSGGTINRIHPYNVTRLPEYNPTYENLDHISSLAHLKWGLYRFYVDALLYFGNIRQAYRILREKPFDQLEDFFTSKRFDTFRLTSRGAPLAMKAIAKDDRYLIAEMACKTYDTASIESLERNLKEEFKRRSAEENRRITFRDLINPPKQAKNPRQVEMEFSMNEVLDEAVSSEEEVAAKIEPLLNRFKAAREKVA